MTRDERLNAVCPECGKRAMLYVARGGDGSALHFRSHKADGKWCIGRFVTVWMPEDDARYGVRAGSVE